VERTVWRDWKTALGRTQVNWMHESAVMMPVAVAMQAVLGPSLHLQLLVGAFWGVLAVVLAWLVGRSSRSAEFGLAFGVLVAASPLQIAWSRLGGLHIGGNAHVLLALWLGYLAGKRGSLVLAVLAGVTAWASVYHYYSARLALPLAFIGLVAGAYAGSSRRRPSRSPPRSSSSRPTPRGRRSGPSTSATSATAARPTYPGSDTRCSRRCARSCRTRSGSTSGATAR
jgi:hypothetical protein